jgi:putative cell wall-binding protein
MSEPSRSFAPAWRRAAAGAVLLAFVVVPATAASAETTTRLAEGSNVQVAIEYSQLSFEDDAAPVALLARDDDFADTLTSGSVQGLLNAPLLLTNRSVLSPETAGELDRLGAESVIIMGGPDAVDPAVETQLNTLGFDTTRVFGPTRVETATEVAEAFFPIATVAVLARAFPAANDPTTAFADSLTAGNYSAASETPVLLTDRADLADSTRAYIESSLIETALVAGGNVAISDPVVEELRSIPVGDLNPPDDQGTAALPFEARRVAGSTRAGTAVAFAMELDFANAADSPRIILIESREADAWASGLTAGAQATNGAATLLTDGPNLFDETRAFLGTGADVPLICGPRVDAAACDAASNALGNEG